MLYAPEPWLVFQMAAHKNPEWHKLFGGSSSAARSQMLSKLSHPGTKTSLRAAGLVMAPWCPTDLDPQPHPTSRGGKRAFLSTSLGLEIMSDLWMQRLVSSLHLKHLKTCAWSRLAAWVPSVVGKKWYLQKALHPWGFGTNFRLGWVVFCRSISFYWL